MKSFNIQGVWVPATSISTVTEPKKTSSYWNDCWVVSLLNGRVFELHVSETDYGKRNSQAVKDICEYFEIPLPKQPEKKNGN